MDALVMVCDVDLDVPDGARTHTVEVARGFARAGLSVELVARGEDPGLDGVRLRAARGREPGDRVRRVASINARTIGALWRRRRQGSRFYVRHKWSTMPATLAARLLRYRVVSEVDDLPYGPTYEGQISVAVDWFKRLMTFLMGRLSHGVVAGTDEARQLLVREFHVPAERIGVVPIGVDVDYFRPLDREQAIRDAGLDPGCRYLLFVGQFAGWVDFDTLLDAFAIVAGADSDLRLLLVGDGAERARIESRVRELGIEPAVIITGFVRDRRQVRSLLGSATVALASHRAEHLNRIGMNATKLAEYLAAGRPIVAKDVARLREMVQDTGAGLVIRDGPEEMAGAMRTLLEPGQAAITGSRARELAVQRYSWEATVRATLPLFGDRARR